MKGLPPAESSTETSDFKVTPELRKLVRIHQYSWMMRLLGAAYSLAAVFAFFLSSELISFLNLAPKLLSFTEALPRSETLFWEIIAASGFAGLACLSFVAAASPGVKGYPIIHLVVKAFSIAGFAWMLLNGPKYFAYGAALIFDIPIAIWLLWSIIRVPLPPLPEGSGL